MYQGNYLKFSQNQDLLAYLASTRGKVLVEASPYDKIWGVGWREKDGNISNPMLWKGENLLGFILMEVRDDLLKDISTKLKNELG